MGDDPIFALNAEASARLSAGESIINATVGALLEDDGKLSIIEAVLEAFRQVPPHVAAAYAPIPGSSEFRKAVIADLFESARRSEPPNDLRQTAAHEAIAVATPGGTGALRHAISNFLEPGQSVLTTSYYWGPYRTLADELDRKISTFEMFDREGRFNLPHFAQKLEELQTAEGRALIFLNSPCHNPTGYSLDESEWRAISDIVASATTRAPVALLLDLAYARYQTANLNACLHSLLPLRDRAMLLFAWSASKSFTQYGARVGALVAVHADPEERSRVENALTYSCRGTWSNCNALGMAAITRALTDPDVRSRVEVERARLRELLDRRVAVFNELATSVGLRYPRYDGGFFTTVFCDEAPFVANRLKDDGIFVVPQPGALRIALSSVAERNIARLVERLLVHARP